MTVKEQKKFMLSLGSGPVGPTSPDAVFESTGGEEHYRATHLPIPCHPHSRVPQFCVAPEPPGAPLVSLEAGSLAGAAECSSSVQGLGAGLQASAELHP
ncbi:unnamed protein product [Gadus morhua 'NCC']